VIRRREARLIVADHHRLLDVLAEEGSFEQRMDAALTIVHEAVQLPDAYLYVGEPGERRLHLEFSRARGAEDPTRMAPGPLVQTLEGGAEWIAPTPPLEVVGDELGQPRPVTSAVGRLFSAPLFRGGELFGLVQAGPLSEAGMPGASRRRLLAMADTLALVVEHARIQHLLRAELTAVTAREERGRRLAGSALDADRFLTLLLELAIKATRSQGGFVAVLDPDRGALAVRVEQGMPDGFAERVDLGRETGLFDWSLGTPPGALVVRDFDQALALGIRSMLAVPLSEDGRPLGVFALATFSEQAQMDERGLELLGTYATQATLMLDNARLFARFSDRYLETVRGLARSLDTRRPYLEGHHQLVGGAAEALGQALELTPAERQALGAAGLIHDVGLAAVGDDQEAFEANLEHPLVGATMVEHLPLEHDVAEAIATHHEWFDGWGFPRGLRGDQIPLAGRILAAAEFLVEMATPMPVREGYGPERLVDELEQRRGSQFDPRVVEAAVRLVREGTLEVAGPLSAGTLA
jgi:GAF domain-containing protein